MNNFSVTIVGDLYEGVTSEDLAAQLAGAGDVLVPGCLFSDVVAVRGAEEGEEDKVRVTAQVLADDRVQGGDWDGDEVTAEFITSYITGAAEFWVSGGDMFSPSFAFALQA